MEMSDRFLKISRTPTPPPLEKIAARTIIVNDPVPVATLGFLAGRCVSCSNHRQVTISRERKQQSLWTVHSTQHLSTQVHIEISIPTVRMKSLATSRSINQPSCSNQSQVTISQRKLAYYASSCVRKDTLIRVSPRRNRRLS